VVMPNRTTVLDEGFVRPATPRTVDFSSQKNLFYTRDENGLMRVTNHRGIPFDKSITTEQTNYDESGLKNSPGTGLSATARQKRARARRRLKKGITITKSAWNELYKPLEEWDMEELARGRPRNAGGTFSGRPPEFVTRELHERAMERFKMLVRDEMSAQSMNAIATIQMILDSEEVDAKGKPIVSAAAKMDAAKFLLEHVVGKPVQPTQTDISVKLQGILGVAMVNPADVMAGNYTLAHTGSRGAIEGETPDDDEIEDGDD